MLHAQRCRQPRLSHAGWVASDMEHVLDRKPQPLQWPTGGMSHRHLGVRHVSAGSIYPPCDRVMNGVKFHAEKFNVGTATPRLSGVTHDQSEYTFQGLISPKDKGKPLILPSKTRAYPKF